MPQRGALCHEVGVAAGGHQAGHLAGAASPADDPADRPAALWLGLGTCCACAVAGGLSFISVFADLMVTAAVPLTSPGDWRGPIGVVAVVASLAGMVPLAGMMDPAIIGGAVAVGHMTH